MRFFSVAPVALAVVGLQAGAFDIGSIIGGIGGTGGVGGIGGIGDLIGGAVGQAQKVAAYKKVHATLAPLAEDKLVGAAVLIMTGELSKNPVGSEGRIKFWQLSKPLLPAVDPSVDAKCRTALSKCQEKVDLTAYADKMKNDLPGFFRMADSAIFVTAEEVTLVREIVVKNEAKADDKEVKASTKVVDDFLAAAKEVGVAEVCKDKSDKYNCSVDEMLPLLCTAMKDASPCMETAAASTDCKDLTLSTEWKNTCSAVPSLGANGALQQGVQFAVLAAVATAMAAFI